MVLYDKIIVKYYGKGGKTMVKTKRIFIFLTIIAILLSNSYIYAGVTDVTGGSGATVNTTVRDNYTDYQVTDDINLEKDKDYIIDFTKEDNLSKALSHMADLEGTVYYKVVVDGNKASLSKTEDSSEAVIKIIGNQSENKAVMTLINTDSNKSYNLNFMYTKYTGSKLTYTGTTYEDGKVKKALIIYAILLVLTVIVPAIVCFSQSDDSSSKELINIFNTFINAMSF